MQVSGASFAHGPHGVNAPHGLRGPHRPQTTAPQGGVDRLEISEAAQAASRASESAPQGEGIRADLVGRIRSQIAAGTYETPDKLGAAVDRLLNELG